MVIGVGIVVGLLGVANEALYGQKGCPVYYTNGTDWIDCQEDFWNGGCESNGCESTIYKYKLACDCRGWG